MKVTREAEFDEEQYELLAALAEYEAGLGHHGLPLEETTSWDASPKNPDAKWRYEPVVLRDWYDDAIEQRRAEFKDDPSTARVFTARRVPTGK